MILKEDSNTQFGVSSVFEFFMIFPIFWLSKIKKKKYVERLKVGFLLAFVQKIRARLQELLQKRPIIPPQQINVSLCQSRFFPKGSLGGRRYLAMHKGELS